MVKDQSSNKIASPKRQQANSSIQVIDQQIKSTSQSKKVKRGANLSDITSQNAQARIDKYQKMMLKVKSNDKKDLKKGHQRIKSTNDGVIMQNVFTDQKQVPVNRSTDRQNEQNIEIINPQKVKITFVGDQALLKKQSKPGAGGYTQKQTANITKQAPQRATNQKPKITQFHRDTSGRELESMSNSATEC